MRVRSSAIVALLICLFCTEFLAEASPGGGIPELDRVAQRAAIVRFVRSRLASLPVSRSQAEWAEFRTTVRSTLERAVFQNSYEFQAAMSGPPTVKLIREIRGSGVRITDYRFKLLENLWIPALVYEPPSGEPAAAVIVYSAHDYDGNAAPDKHALCLQLAGSGLRAVSVEWFGMGSLNLPGFYHFNQVQLYLVGVQPLALFHLYAKRSVDFAASLRNGESLALGTTGFSGGAWQSVFTAAIDARIEAVHAIAGFGLLGETLTDLGDPEQLPINLGPQLHNDHLAALLAPRRVHFSFNERDGCCYFGSKHVPLITDLLHPIYQSHDAATRFTTYISPGIGDHRLTPSLREQAVRFFAGPKANLDTPPIATPPLAAPEADLLDFQSLAAMYWTRRIQQTREIPPDAAVSRAQLRQRLGVIKPASLSAPAKVCNSASSICGAVSLPGLWVHPYRRTGDGINCELHLNGEGAETNDIIPGNGVRIYQAASLGWSEAAAGVEINRAGYALEMVGQRIIGIAIGYIKALIHAAEREGCTAVSIVASDRSAGAAALLGAAAEMINPSEIRIHRALDTFERLFTENAGARDVPLLFPFDIVTVGDIAELVDLAAPTKIIFLDWPESRSPSQAKICAMEHVRCPL